MLPLLLKYRNARITFRHRHYPSLLLISPNIKREDFKEAIDSVKAGEIIGQD
jgi:hypothetical protein